MLKLWLAAAPWDPLVAARAFSAACAMAATVALDRLWLRDRSWIVGPRCWAVDALPCLLLYARMARSYTLQLLLALLGIEAAAGWLRTRRMGAALRFAGLEALLLYTHYLPGLAVGGAAFLLGLRKAPRQTALAGALVAAAYLPWLGALWSSLGKAAAHEAYSLTGAGVMEHAVRMAYLGLSFSVGEAVSLWQAIAGGVLALLLAGLYVWALRVEPDVRRSLAALAAVAAYLGASQWVSFPFLPARLLFVLPFALWAAAWAAGRRSRLGLATTAALVVTSLAGQAMYWRQDGFLNKGYLIPYGEIAAGIAAGDPDRTLTLADAFNGDPKPLRAALPPTHTVLEAVGPEFPRLVEAALAQRRPARIWYVRAARDVSPGRLHAQVERLLAERYTLAERRLYLPYSALDRAALLRLSGEPPPSHHFQVEEWILP